MKNYEHIEGDIYLRIEVYHRRGEGYYASVFPITRTKHGNFWIEKFLAYSGYKKLVLERKTYSFKGEEKAVEMSQEILSKMKEKVKTNLLTQSIQTEQ